MFNIAQYTFHVNNRGNCFVWSLLQWMMLQLLCKLGRKSIALPCFLIPRQPGRINLQLPKQACFGMQGMKGLPRVPSRGFGSSGREPNEQRLRGLERELGLRPPVHATDHRTNDVLANAKAMLDDMDVPR